jgi:hypothetical protein
MHSPSLKQWVAKGLTPKSSEKTDEAKSTEAEGSTTPASDSRKVQKDDLAGEKEAEASLSSVLNGFGTAENAKQSSAIITVDDASEEARKEASPYSSDPGDGVVDPLSHAITNKAITCAHGKLDPGETQNIRVISAVRPRY